MFDRLISLIAPHACLACERTGSLLCADCLGMLQTIPSVCYRCGTATTSFSTCRACMRQTKLDRVYVCTQYEGFAKDLVWKLKFAGARAAANDMAALMATLPDSAELPMFVTHAPTVTSRIRTRGYDQAQLIARSIGRRVQLPVQTTLVRLDQHRQVGASRTERLAQLEGAFRVRRAAQVAGRHILLVDDVLTTGATLEAAARVLKQAGAKRVDAIVFARA